MTGQTISHFKILAAIGEDASGSVYKAQDTVSDRLVSIRILAPAVSADAERRARIEKDAMAASALEHPNIARVSEFGRDGDTDFVVMEAREGESVYEVLERERPHRRHLLRYAKQMTGALTAAHGAGLIHGPLNPQTIFISPKKQIKLHGFGFGALDPAPDSAEAQQVAFGAGAPYISPEQVGGARPDIRSDIFSLGALLYHMTTGRLPFRDEGHSDMWKAILKDDPTPVTQLTSRSPVGMDKLLDRCLRKNPQKRFQQVSELQPLLEKMADEYFQNPKRQMSAWSRNRGRIARVAGVALAATAAVAGAVIWWQSRTPQESVLGKQLRQLTENSGYDTEPVVSLDGTQLAYASDRAGAGNLDIWVQPASGGEARRVTSDAADDREPSFSPDGLTIAFRSERNGGGAYLVSSKGGEARLLAPGGRRPRYSPDGRWIAYWVGPPGYAPKADRAYKIFVIPAAGGAVRQIHPDFASAVYPIWSPDSRRLLFLGRADAASASVGGTEWWVTTLDGDHLTSTGACSSFRAAGIASESQYELPGDWKGNHIFFSLPDMAGSNIWRADIAPASLAVSGKPVRVTKGSGIEVQPFAADGRVVFATESLNVDIWGVPVMANEGRTTGEPVRLTKDPGVDVSPSLSADGSRLSFQSNRGGRYKAWVMDVKSGTESPLKPGPQEQLWPLISPDGASVAFSEQRIGKFEHFYKRVGEGATEVLCEDCGPLLTGWSRDSKMVLIDSFPAASRSRVAVTAIKLGSREKMVLAADPAYDATQARFSPDGRWIVFTGRMDGGLSRLFVAPFHGQAASSGKEWIALTDGASWDVAPNWSPDGKLVYFISTRDGFRCVWAQRLDGASKPSGAAFAVSHFHSAARSPAMLPFDNTDLFVGGSQLLVSLGTSRGNIWSVKLSR